MWTIRVGIRVCDVAPSATNHSSKFPRQKINNCGCCRSSTPHTDAPEARRPAMPRLLRVLRGRRSWQGHMGWYRRPPEESRVQRTRFALCSAASAPGLSSMARTRTHPRRFPSMPLTCRQCLCASASKACACRCSSDAPYVYEHQPPVPIAHFGPRLRAPTCRPHDVPGVLPGVIGTERSRS